MTIGPRGALVTIKQTGATLWSSAVVQRRPEQEGEYAMNDKEFFELELRATICPGQCEWPAPECLHWQRLHEAVTEARERVSKAYLQMDEIDRNASLSSDIKYRRRCEIADQAIADLEASKTLARARAAIELALAKHQFEQNVSPEIAKARDATVKAMKEAEHGWQRAIDKIAERASLTRRSNSAPP